MKNLLNEKPSHDLTGRLLESVNFVETENIQDKAVLNIGCGFGWCELNFLDRDVKHITGIEISDSNLKTAQENIINDRASFQVASAIALPFPDGSFDTVVCWEVLEHIPKHTENQMFSEVYRVLKEGGIFYLSTPYKSFFATTLDPAWWLIGHRHYTKEQLLQFANNRAFDTLEMRVRGGWWATVALLNMYFSKWILRRRPLLQKFFNEKETVDYSKEGFANIFAKFKKHY